MKASYRIPFVSLYPGTLLFSLLLFFSCSPEIRQKIEIDPEFGQYISAYSSGIVSNQSGILIQLAADHPEKKEPLVEEERELFSVEPAVKGKVYWNDARTLEFKPDERLRSNTEYVVTFHLSELMDVPDQYGDFVFQIKTREQSLDIYSEGLSTYDMNNLKRQKLEGQLVLADHADTALLGKCLRATQEDKELKIEWNHSEGTVHRFVVHDVARKERRSAVKLTWNGSELGTSDAGEKNIEVPALGDFRIMEIYVNQTPEQYIVVHYSDPLKADQNFTGLVTISDANNLNYVVEGHKLQVYPSTRLSGTKLFNVFRGVKNVNGYACPDEESVELVFEELKPEVRFIGEGNIIPTSEKGMLFPFEAVNLNAVDVQVTRIYQNNIVQFLQVNNMDGNSQLKRVGKQILKKKIELDPEGKLNLADWNQFSIDISTLVKAEPGAIYHVNLSYNKNYSVYTCEGESGQNSGLTELTSSDEDEEWNERGWGSFDYGYYYEDYDSEEYYYYDYDYSERQNPCSNSYYYGKGISKNVLISDIGIIAKAGSDKVMNVFVNDIRNTEPMPDVKVEFYDFQQQQIGKIFTDGQGHAHIKLDTKPFVIIASKNNQRGYLRLRDGEALSLSKFDVDGETVQRGVKGFIYTERGVWRPGDSIYISFMLEDKEFVLPKSHPVSMELLNPQGVVVQKMVKTQHVNGLYDFRTATQQEDPTGYYTVNIHVGNRKFSKSLRVETVKPNRLKIYLDFGGERLSVATANQSIKLNSKWLHGAPAKNLNARVEVTVNSIATTFKNYKEYIFDDPTRSYNTEEQVIFDGQLDENGDASFVPDIEIGTAAPGMLRAHFTTRVFEEGGGFSIDRSSVEYSPYSSYIGIRVPEGDQYNGTLETDKDHIVDVVTVDDKGKPVSRRNLEVKVYNIRWRYWWDNYDNDLASYIANNSIVPVLDTRINTSNGKGKFVLRVNRPSWGRYLVHVKDPETGHASGKVVYIDWPYWARANRKDNENATMLSFSTDKETYAVGEKVKVTFPSSSGGRALVSIESGIKMIQHFWIETSDGETKFEFDASAAMAPNCYVNISLLQAHAVTANDLPIRLYGVLPIKVENPDSHLSPQISMPDVIRPESKATVSVKEKQGKEMTYTLALVDEGLLDLTSFKTPDPWNHFNAREALGVKTWDLYDLVMGSFTAKLDKMLAIGGDGEGESKKGAKANRFKPMVHFAGPFHLKANGTGVHHIAIPNYVGSVRVMVVAGQDLRYGHAEKTVAVRNPLMVLGTLPRVLGPGETVQLPVNVFAMEKHVKDVSIEILPNELLKPVNGTKKSIRFSSIGDEVVNFELQVAEKVGVGKIKIVAKSGKEVARHEIEIDVRTPNPKVTDVVETVIEPGKNWNPEFAFNGVEGTNKLTLEVSSIPMIDLGNRLKYLIQYPHGCIEQTTSGVFPQLFLSNIMELDHNFKREITTNVNAAIKRIQLFQTSDGGFSYWPGEGVSSDWGTSYAGHFLLEAEAKGYRVPSSLKGGWIKYQQKLSRNWRSGTANSEYGSQQYDDLSQAYRLYTLALAKHPELGAMNRLRETSNLSMSARWRLAAAYQLAGQTDVAKKLLSTAHSNIPAYRELSYTYGSDIRDKAMILEVMALTKQKAKGAVLMKELAKELNNQQWMSTQTTAYCLVGISKFVGQSPQNKTMKFSYSLNGGTAMTKSTQVAVFKNEMAVKSLTKGGKLLLKNTGAGLLYAKLSIEGVPKTGDQSTAANNVSLDVNYFSMSGQRINVSRIEQGTDFIAEVTVNNPGTRGYLAEMALNQVFPGGWEIHNTRMDEFVSAVQSDYPTYQDIRDDRVYTYFSVGAGKTKTFRFKLNAAYLGRFYLPTISTEAMYDNTIHARVPGQWIEVVKPGSEHVATTE